MKQILIIFVALFACSNAQFWRGCHLAKPTPTSVTSSQCTSGTCIVNRGGSLTGTVVFTPTVAHFSIEMFLRVQLAPNLPWTGIPITTPGALNACLSMSPGCPTVAGVPQTLTLNLPIPITTTPFVNANFEIWLGAILPIPFDVMCFQVTATIL